MPFEKWVKLGGISGPKTTRKGGEEWDSVCFCIIPKARREICIQQQKAFMNIVQSYGALDMEAYFYCNGKRRHCFLYFSVFFDSSQVEGSANLAPNGGRLILKKSTKLLSFAQHLSNCLAIEISLSISCLTKSRCQCSQQLATVGILGEGNWGWIFWPDPNSDNTVLYYVWQVKYKEYQGIIFKVDTRRSSSNVSKVYIR